MYSSSPHLAPHNKKKIKKIKIKIKQPLNPLFRISPLPLLPLSPNPNPNPTSSQFYRRPAYIDINDMIRPIRSCRDEKKKKNKKNLPSVLPTDIRRLLSTQTAISSYYSYPLIQSERKENMTTAFRETRDKDRTSVPVSTDSTDKRKTKLVQKKEKRHEPGYTALETGLQEGKEKQTRQGRVW